MHEPGPEKSLLHEKLFEKNASLAKGFANWVDDNYNKVTMTNGIVTIRIKPFIFVTRLGEPTFMQIQNLPLSWEDYFFIVIAF